MQKLHITKVHRIEFPKGVSFRIQRPLYLLFPNLHFPRRCEQDIYRSLWNHTYLLYSAATNANRLMMTTRPNHLLKPIAPNLLRLQSPMLKPVLRQLRLLWNPFHSLWRILPIVNLLTNIETLSIVLVALPWNHLLIPRNQQLILTPRVVNLHLPTTQIN